MAKRATRPAFGYVRVSTDEQVEHRTSVESQIQTIQQEATKRDFHIVRMFVEPGISDSDHRRPQFRTMMSGAIDPGHPVDAIIAV